MTTGGQAAVGKPVAKKSRSADIEQQRRNAVEYQKKFLIGKCSCRHLRVNYTSSPCVEYSSIFFAIYVSHETASVASVTPNNNKLISNKRGPETDEDDSTQSKKQKKNGTFEHTTKLEDNQGQRKKAYQWSLEQVAAVDVQRNGKSGCHNLSLIF